MMESSKLSYAVKKTAQIKKYVRGACANCGSMNHQEKQCCDRPRQVGAEFKVKSAKSEEPEKDIAPKQIYNEFKNKQKESNLAQINMRDPKNQNKEVKVIKPTVTGKAYKAVKQKKEQEKMIGGLYMRQSGPHNAEIIPNEAGSYRQKKKQPLKTKYTEDVHNGEHSSVWGSWWNETLGWGYECCNSSDKVSACLGEKGKRLSLQKEYKIRKDQQDEANKKEKPVLEEELEVDQPVAEIE